MGRQRRLHPRPAQHAGRPPLFGRRQRRQPHRHLRGLLAEPHLRPQRRWRVLRLHRALQHLRQPVSLAAIPSPTTPTTLPNTPSPRERPFPRTAIASSTPPAGRTPRRARCTRPSSSPPRARACFCAMARAAPSARGTARAEERSGLVALGGRLLHRRPRPHPRLPNSEQSAAALRAQVTQGNTSGVYINELMASEKSRPHDWLEVYNSSAQAVDISGWGLSDDAASPRKWRFPQGTVIQPGDYLTLYLSGTDGVTRAAFCTPPSASPPTAGTASRSRTPPARCWTASLCRSSTRASPTPACRTAISYTIESTPNQQNSAEGSQGRTAAPEASAPGGIYHTATPSPWN